MEWENGQMTVFLSLLLISFLLVLNVCVEGIYAWMEKGAFVCEEQLVAMHAEANYHKELWEQFHLFAIDGRYYRKMEANLCTKWVRDGHQRPNVCLIQPGDNLTDVETLRTEIADYMKYKKTADLIKKLSQSLKGVEEESDAAKLGNQIGKAKTGEEEIEAGGEKTEQVKDPRKDLRKLLSGNVVTLVLPKDHKLSKHKIFICYGKKGTETLKNPDFFKPSSVESSLKSNRKKQAVSAIATEGLAVSYCAEVFRCAQDNKKEDGICYEMEYLIGGKDKDDENLNLVVHKLLLIRMCLNYGYLMTSEAKKAQAKALAAGIAGPAAGVPGVVAGISLLLMAAWSYAESIVDLRGLLEGKKIAVKKSDATWQLSISHLGKAQGTAKEVKNGISYRDYLEILLLLQTKKDEKYKRMMDLISLRIQETQKDFTLMDSYYSFGIETQEQVPSLLMGPGYTFVEKHMYSY